MYTGTHAHEPSIIWDFIWVHLENDADYDVYNCL
jgi:hypothetical protein